MSLNERYRAVYMRLYGFKDFCDEQHNNVMRELEKELSAVPEGREPDAWRWRVKANPPLPWLYAGEKQTNLAASIEWEVEPLYARGPQQHSSKGEKDVG